MDVLIKNLGLLINATLIATPPLLLAALGSCFSERSGVINIGIEGMMTIGAFTGAVLGLETGNGWLAFFGAGLAGALFGVIHAIASMQTRRLPELPSISLALVLRSFCARPCTITLPIRLPWIRPASFQSCLTECSPRVPF